MAKCKVAEPSEIPPGQAKVVEAEGRTLAVFNCDGTFYAIENTCLHRGGPLGEGDLDGTIVTCPWHGWSWDVRTGANAVNPAVKVGSFPARVEDGIIFVEI
jgi:nitrite reductase/ring-hydroxylating ferredoxin subunit